jgi:hypothetical protein
MEPTFNLSYQNNEYQNYSVLAAITDFSDFEKGQFRKENQKFIFNGKIAFKDIYILFFDSMRDIELLGAPFNERILLNPNINSKTYNPKVLAFVYLFGVTITQYGSLILMKESIKKMIKMLVHFEKTGIIQFEGLLQSKDERLKEIIKENGITSQNIIRYVHFFEKFLSNIK